MIFNRFRFLILVLALITFNSFAYTQTCLPAPVGLVAWWTGNGNTLDLRSRNNGTLQNGATFTTGQVGQSFLFDGVNDSIDSLASPNPVLNFGSNNFTVEAWVKTSSSGTARTIYGNGYNINPLVLMRIESDNRARFIIRDNAGVALDVLGTTTNLNDGVWHHIAGIREGTTARLYVDGVQQNSASNGAFDQINSVCNFAFIGGFRSDSVCTSPANEAFFNGSIDEVSVYNRNLSTAEIQSIFNSSTTGKCQPTATIAPSGLGSLFSGDATTSSTNNNLFLLSTGTPGFAIGKVGQGFNLDGIDDDYHNSFMHNVINFVSGSYSIELWAKPNTLSGTKTLISQRSIIPPNPNLGYALFCNSSGFWKADFTDTTNTVISAVSSTPATTGSFTHLTMVIDRGTNQLRLYVNGVLQSQQSFTAGNTGVANPQMTIGASESGGVRSDFFNGVIDEVSFYNRAITQNEITSIFNAGIAGKLKSGTTSTGSDVIVSTTSDATVTFPNVSTAGITQQIPLDLLLLPNLPNGFNPTSLNYDISTSAVFSGSPEVCFSLFSITNSNLFNNLRILHLENNTWQNRTGTIDFNTKTLCSSGLTSLSPFAIAAVSPTAANASISGRVTTASGRGISNVTLQLTNLTTNEVRNVRSNNFGRYSFADLESGGTYILSIASRKFTFTNPSRVITLSEDLTDADFVSEGK